MQLQAQLNDLSKPENIQQLVSILSELAEQLDPLYTETAPNGNISARTGRIAIYKNGSAYETWQNTTGSTVWVRVDYGAASDIKVKASSGDATADYLDGKVAKSIVVTSDKLELSGDAAAPGNSKYYGTNGAGTKGWNSLPVDTNMSNVLYCWFGSDNASTNIFGRVEGTSLTPNMGAYTVNYEFFGVNGATPRTILTGRFVKIAGISTITIHGRIWADTTDGGTEAVLTVDVGGQSNTVKSVTSTTPTWVATSTIDVSGLSNGTIYDITIQLNNEGAGGFAYCSGIILTGS